MALPFEIKSGTSSGPQPIDVHVNQPLTNAAEFFAQNADNYIGERLFPNIPTTKQSDLYPKFDREDMLRDSFKEVTAGAETEGDSYTLSDEPFYTKNYGLHQDIPDMTIANQDAWVRARETSTLYLTEKAMIRKEKIFLGATFKASTWDTNPVLGTTAGYGAKWSAANSDPIADVKTMRREIHKNTGKAANKIAMTRSVYDTLTEHDAILQRIGLMAGATTAMPAQVTPTLLAALFEVDMIFVSNAIENTADKGQDLNSNFILDDGFLIGYFPDSAMGYQASGAIVFSWTRYTGVGPSGIYIRDLRIETREVTRVEAKFNTTIKVTAPSLGVYVADAI